MVGSDICGTAADVGIVALLVTTTAAALGVDAAPLPDRFRAYEVSSVANTLEIAASAAFTGYRGAADADAAGVTAAAAAIVDFDDVDFCVDVEGLGLALDGALAARGPAWPAADGADE